MSPSISRILSAYLMARVSKPAPKSTIWGLPAPEDSTAARNLSTAASMNLVRDVTNSANLAAGFKASHLATSLVNFGSRL